MRTMDRTGSAVVSLPNDLEIQVVRRFDAPAALVYEVWTTPEHIRNWWGYPPQRLVSTEIYEAFPDVEAVNTLTLAEHGGVTTMTILSRYPSKEVRDSVIESGMEHGLQVSLNRAEAILINLLEPADG